MLFGRRGRRFAAVVLTCAAAAWSPAFAARPLPDSGKWDRTFALYARDVALPWKPISIRLDTYSGAPVDLAAYEADPAEVLVAGAVRARALDTAHRLPVARWRFTPPTGARYTPNDVDVPLQGREGFFVIEARRGDAVQQTWLDITRVGLLTKESPSGLVLYAADLATGRALPKMRVTFLVGNAFRFEQTDEHGVLRWNAPERPRFAIAQWGKSRTFVSLLPQPPVPAALTGVRVDRAAVRAGERVRAIGFARRRVGSTYRPATGDARLTLVMRGRTLATASARLDAAGAFTAELPVPPGAAAGDAAVLAAAGGASGGAALHIDAVADGVVTVAAACDGACPADGPVPLLVSVKRSDGAPLAGRDVRVRVVRSPHVPAPDTGTDSAGWGTTAVLDTHVRTDGAGTARAVVPGPTDGLASTLAVEATIGGASATTRVVIPTAPVALEIVPERERIDPSRPAIFEVRGFEAVDGRPAAGLPVRVRLVHGTFDQEQTVTLDADGRAQATFRNPVAGTSLAFARADVAGRTALDANAIAVAPDALLATRSRGSAEVRLVTDRSRYRVGDRVAVDATLPGAIGDAFLDLEGTHPMGERTVGASGGRAGGAFRVPETLGDASVGVAFVRDGTLAYATRRIPIDGPGHARATALTADRSAYAPGAIAHLRIEDGGLAGDATLAIRLADARAAAGASFDDAPAILAGTGTTTQSPTTDEPGWHGSVTPTRSTAIDLAATERAGTAPEAPVAGGLHALQWRVVRTDKETFDVPLPQTPGRYVVSVLKVCDDGDVGAATLALEVR